MTGIITATAIVGAVGLFIGLFLGVAAIKFKVEVDEKEEAVLAALPGNNCGGCGFPGKIEHAQDRFGGKEPLADKTAYRVRGGACGAYEKCLCRCLGNQVARRAGQGQTGSRGG